MRSNLEYKIQSRTANSTYPKGGVSCSKDSFVVNGTFVFPIKFCGKSPALRVAAKRYKPLKKNKTEEKCKQICIFVIYIKI